MGKRLFDRRKAWIFAAFVGLLPGSLFVFTYVNCALPIHGPKQILFRHSQRKKKFLFSSPKMPTILWKPAMYRPISLS